MTCSAAVPSDGQGALREIARLMLCMPSVTSAPIRISLLPIVAFCVQAYRTCCHVFGRRTTMPLPANAEFADAFGEDRENPVWPIE